LNFGRAGFQVTVSPNAAVVAMTEPDSISEVWRS
jgi:hypothetical protein